MSAPAAGESFGLKFKEAEQNEKAYQKQDAIFIGRKRVLGAKKSKKVILLFNIIIYLMKF